MGNDQLARIEARIDELTTKLDWGPYRVENWLRRCFDEPPEYKGGRHEIRTCYTAWRKDQTPPMSDVEEAMIVHLIYYYLNRLTDEGFIVRPGGKSRYLYQRSP